jgi:membrane protein
VGVTRQLERIDDAQQRREKLAIAFATVKKYGEDGSSNLASMIAFWAFFSIFPLLLALITILGYVLPSGTRTEVLARIASFMPLLDPGTLHGLTGSWWPILIGLGTALWSGLAVVKTTQVAFNSVWEIPKKDRPGFVEKLGRSLLALSTIGAGLVIATIISGYVTGKDTGIDLGWYGRLAGYVIAILLDVGLFVAAFRVLTDRDVDVRTVLPGAVLAGLAFWVLQQISSFIIARRLGGAQSTYGNSATVITMLWWIYLQAQITMLGAQLNVVLADRLYPRSLVGGPETEADARALDAYAEEQTYHERQAVDSRVRREPRGDARRPR